MQYDFDRIIDRTSFDSSKWTTYPAGVLPLWVADSDFTSPQPVIDAVRRTAELGLYGYPNAHAGIVERAAVAWCRRRHGFEPAEDQVFFCPSMSFALALAIRALTRPGDRVLMQTPIYPPFIELTRANGRECSLNPLRPTASGRHEIDFEDFERRAADPRCTLLLLCSPHNPTGRLLSRDELERIVDICARHGVTIFSDEVHSGCVFAGEHASVPALSERAARITVWGSSPSKTFNTPGLRAAVVASLNPDLCAKLAAEAAATPCDRNVFAQRALEAAWTLCDDYAEQVSDYVRANLEFAVAFIAERIPALHAQMPEATYLLWIDCRGLGFGTQAELTDFLLKEAKVALNPGDAFGPGGEGHVRLNAACPRATLAEALERIARAVARRTAAPAG